MLWLLLFLSPLVFIIARYIWELFRVGDLSSKAVLITGCDSGFGRELSLKCIKAGFTVFAGCLTQKGEISLKAECPSTRLHTLPLDVTSDESVKKAKHYVEQNIKEGLQLWGLVNNAGIFSCYGPDDWTTVDDYIHAAEVNTFGVVRVTHAFKRMIKHSEGRIVTVTSVNGRLATPAAGPYVVSKFGAEAYMDSIRQELHCMGVKVSILEPGIFRTGLIDEKAMLERVEKVWARLDEQTKIEYGEEYKNYFANMWNDLFMTRSSTKIHYVVDNYFHALTAKYPRDRYYCGWDAILMIVPLSLLPTWLSDYVVWTIGKQELEAAAVEERKNRKKKC